MKRFSLTTVIAVFLSVIFNGIQAQQVTSNLDQPKLMNQFLGKWQANTGKDTLEVWDFQQYGKGWIINAYKVVNGKKIPIHCDNISYNPKDGKFNGFTLNYDGNYGTWISSFTSAKKGGGIFVQNFNPEPVYGKFESISKNPDEWSWTSYRSDGTKEYDLQFVRVK
jgi:hypothetical protein